MNLRKVLATVAVSAALAGTAITAQAPIQNVEASRHPHLAAAQGLIAQAYQKILDAQAANKDQLQDHAEKAKKLLDEASNEIGQAASSSNERKK
jgi:hypothetical protein